MQIATVTGRLCIFDTPAISHTLHRRFAHICYMCVHITTHNPNRLLGKRFPNSFAVVLVGMQSMRHTHMLPIHLLKICGTADDTSAEQSVSPLSFPKAAIGQPKIKQGKENASLVENEEKIPFDPSYP